LVYPPRCGGCGRYGSVWCNQCANSVEAIPLPICEKCGDPLPRGHLCGDCRKNPPAFSAMRTFAAYKEPVRSALIKLKYKGEVSLGFSLAWSFAHFIDRQGFAPDIILPVPLSEERLRERGYNQVDYLAKPVAQILGVDYSTKLVKRIRHTRSQVGLGVRERRENVRDAFVADAAKLVGRNVLVIDDTSTTGATLDFVSRAIINVGANNVNCAAYAKALPHDRNEPNLEFLAPKS